MNYTTKDFDFYLPENLIAQTPLEERSSSRLLVLDRETHSLEDRYFYNICDYLNSGDALVLNNTRVLPARLFGQRIDTGGTWEVLLLNNIEGDIWETLIKPARRARVGTQVSFGDGRLKATVIEEREQGGRLLKFEYQGVFLEQLEALGEMPLPPYIKERLSDSERYQTIYAEEKGSAAAPTAGLHFTTDLLTKLRNKGVEIIAITLHVGLGTFRPVSVENLDDHKMHAEYYSISPESAKKIESIRRNEGKIFAVGTTTVRTLESVALQNKGEIISGSGWTDIFITPGYQFQVVDHLLTNFHLPQSTLVMLVSAFYSRDFIMEAYRHAVEMEYRFFSFGDAMLIL